MGQEEVKIRTLMITQQILGKILDPYTPFDDDDYELIQQAYDLIQEILDREPEKG